MTMGDFSGLAYLSLFYALDDAYGNTADLVAAQMSWICPRLFPVFARLLTL